MVKAKRMLCIVAYDIHDDRNRSRISKVLEKYGTRANYSVFECLFTDSQFLKVQSAIEKYINRRCDSVIYYPICVNCYTKIVYQPNHRRVTNTIEIV